MLQATSVIHRHPRPGHEREYLFIDRSTAGEQYAIKVVSLHSGKLLSTPDTGLLRFFCFEHIQANVTPVQQVFWRIGMIYLLGILIYRRIQNPVPQRLRVPLAKV